MHRSFGWPAEPEECLAALERQIEPAKLSERVPEDVRRQFAIVCTIYRYGLFRYDFFALAADQAFLIAETAFRRRFLEYYANHVPFVSKDGTHRHTVETIDYGVLDEAFRQHILSPSTWLLESKVSPQQPHAGFNGSFNALLRWGFDEGLLPGRKGTQIARVFRERRNHAGHPTYRREPPSGPAGDLRTVAELVNCLWDDHAEGGQFFQAPASVHRILTAIGKSRDGQSVWFGRADGLPAWPEADRHAEVTIILANFDSDLTGFEPGFERTAYPCQLMWGPGRWEQAVDFVRRSGIEEDDVEVRGRVFLIRVGSGLRAPIGSLGLQFGPWVEGVESPRSPEAAAVLPESKRSGRWFMIRSDFPNDALEHVVATRHLSQANVVHVIRRAPRCSCGVDELLGGKSWEEALRAAPSV